MALIQQFVGAIAAMAAMSWPAMPAAAVPTTSVVSQRDIGQYASALFQILAVRRVADSRWKTVKAAERPLLKRQAQAAIATILAKHGFDVASFNHLTAEVERRPALRRDVRQRMMREGLGF